MLELSRSCSLVESMRARWRNLIRPDKYLGPVGGSGFSLWTEKFKFQFLTLILTMWLILPSKTYFLEKKKKYCFFFSGSNRWGRCRRRLMVSHGELGQRHGTPLSGNMRAIQVGRMSIYTLRKKRQAQQELYHQPVQPPRGLPFLGAWNTGLALAHPLHTQSCSCRRRTVPGTPWLVLCPYFIWIFTEWSMDIYRSL